MPGEAPSPGYSPPPAGSPYEPPPGSGGGYPPPGGPGYPPGGPGYSPGGPGYPPGGPGYPPPGGPANPPPGGAGYPPAGGPGGGYYGAGGVPTGYANTDEKNWALIAHGGGALGALLSWGSLGWVAPLVALLVRGNQSPTVRAHAVAALNFQIVWSIISVVSLIIGGCLFWLVFPMVLFAVPLIPIIFGVIATIKANDGQLYRYPMSFPIVK